MAQLCPALIQWGFSIWKSVRSSGSWPHLVQFNVPSPASPLTLEEERSRVGVSKPYAKAGTNCQSADCT